MKIAISGSYRSGKTFLGAKLSKHTGIPTFALADKIKEIAAEENPELTHEIYAEDKTTETRQLLTKIAKSYPKYHWLSFMPEGSLILTDLRLSWELEYCQKRNFKVIYIGGHVKDESYNLPEIKKAANLVLDWRTSLTADDIIKYLYHDN